MNLESENYSVWACMMGFFQVESLNPPYVHLFFPGGNPLTTVQVLVVNAIS